MNDSQIIDKAEGALIGSALGDVIGIYTGNSCCDSLPKGKDYS